MFKAAVSAVGALCCVPTAIAQDGPFGFVIGSDINGYECTGSTAGKHVCEPPKPHSDFSAFVVGATDADGICSVTGIGIDTSTNGYGTSLKTKADKIAAQISQIYGSPTERINRLVPGSIWNDPDDWTMAIAMDDRFYAHKWANVRVRGVEEIYVGVFADSSRTGRVNVEFYGANYEKCSAAVSDEQAEAF